MPAAWLAAADTRVERAAGLVAADSLVDMQAAGSLVDMQVAAADTAAAVTGKLQQ